jgi:NAD(P)-dependent dehydrogenase (short-subunit alcohol dehydrogenase family)
VSPVPSDLPHVIQLTPTSEEDLRALTASATWRPRHVRVLVQIGPSRKPEAAQFHDLLALSDLAFLAAKAAEPALVVGGSYCVLLLEGMDGAAPRSATGLFTGLVKSLAHEFPQALVYAVVSATSELGLGLAQLASESRNRRLLPITVYNGRRRTIPIAVPRAEPQTERQSGLALDGSSVVVAVGGSRGITAELLVALAASVAPKMWILGSNPIHEYPAWVYEDSDDEFASRRSDYLRQQRAERPHVTLPQLNREFDRMIHAREASATLRRLGELCGPDRVHYLHCDVTDRATVEGTFAEILSVDPQIDLLLFSAGINRTARVAKKQLQEFRAVRDVKVRGYANLRCALAGHRPRIWCNFGSLIGFTGQVGEVDYAAGNDFLNSCAQHAKLISGVDEFTIGWTLWDNVGLGANPITRTFMKRVGFSDGMTTAEGIDLFLAELSRLERDPAIVHLGRTELATLEQRFSGFDAAMAASASGSGLGTAPPTSYLGQPLVRSDGSCVFERVLDLQTDPYLLGHLVNGHPTMPGTFVLEIAAQAARELVPQRVAVAYESVLFHKFLRLHPKRKSATFRVSAILLQYDDHESRVGVRVTSNVHAPNGMLLRRDQLHFELEVILSDHPPAAPTWKEKTPARTPHPVADPYLIDNPAVQLSGAFDTIRRTSSHSAGAESQLVLRPEAFGEPFQRFQIPVLLLDGLARTSALAMTRGDYLPLIALSSISRIDLYDRRNDGALAHAFQRIRLVCRLEPDDPQLMSYQCAAVADDGHVLLQMRSLSGTLLGYLHALTGRFVTADHATRDPGSALGLAMVQS